MRTHEVVLARIEADLAAGRWAIGERLPAERAFAEELGVSRPSVREAIRVLEAMGVVRTAVGSGPDSGASVIDHPAAGLGSAMRLHLAAGTLPVRDVVALRALLETWAVGQAASRVALDAQAGETVAGARALLDEMDTPGLTEVRFHELDAAFHVLLAALSGNVLVEAVMLGLRGAIQDYVMAGTARLTDWPSTADRLRAEHRTILAAIEAGDPTTASAAVGRHIEDFYREAGL
ncbi:FCD domain-containing protein [Sanguibacter sp. 25GB23B1]|uniref:FadR/GntR family transcriptional regulator n=1 Tax=unclassified Sanguibacter TaxID=2645534 RepID=UPI0032AEF242